VRRVPARDRSDARTRARLFAALAALLLAVPLAPRLPAQASTPVPDARALVARHDSLVGGRALLETRSTLRMLGTFHIAAAGIDAPLEILKVRPDRFLSRTTLGPLGDLLTGYDGTVAWVVQPGQAPLVLRGEQAEGIARQADFFGDLHDLSRFASVETIAEVGFEGRRAWKVRYVRPDSSEVHEYFDVATGLSAGGSVRSRTALGVVELVTVVSEYREFQGIKTATRVVQRNPQFEVVLSIVLVEYDSIDPAAVEPPESVRALLRRDPPPDTP
jgi:hypothetical protein